VKWTELAQFLVQWHAWAVMGLLLEYKFVGLPVVAVNGFAFILMKSECPWMYL
jgi:hypothetical protein